MSDTRVARRIDEIQARIDAIPTNKVRVFAWSKAGRAADEFNRMSYSDITYLLADRDRLTVDLADLKLLEARNRDLEAEGAGGTVTWPGAYDAPVGTIVATTDGVWIRETNDPGGWAGRWRGRAMHGTQGGWIEGLFTDGLATVLRLGAIDDDAAQFNEAFGPNA